MLLGAREVIIGCLASPHRCRGVWLRLRASRGSPPPKLAQKGRSSCGDSVERFGASSSVSSFSGHEVLGYHSRPPRGYLRGRVGPTTGLQATAASRRTSGVVGLHSMCGRITRTSPREASAKEFGVTRFAEVDWLPRYNIAPTQIVGPSSPSTGRSAWDRCAGVSSRPQARSRSSRRSTHGPRPCRRHRCSRTHSDTIAASS